MSMQGQGESQPGEGENAFDDLANTLVGEVEDEAQTEESEGEEPDESEESEEEEAVEEEEAEEPTFTIKVDGKDVTLTQSEMIAAAQMGTDYSKKTMAVAEERKAIEAEKAKVLEVRERHDKALEESIDRLTSFRDYLQEQIGAPPSVDLIQTYGAEYYLAQKEVHEQRKGQLQQAEAAIQHQASERQRQRQAYLQQTAGQTIEALKNTLPGWDENTLPELEKYVNGLGLTQEAMEAGYVQRGLWQLAHKAKAYDAIQAAKAQMKPTQKLTKVSKPAAQNTTGKAAERAKREAAFNKNPSVDALAALLG